MALSRSHCVSVGFALLMACFGSARVQADAPSRPVAPAALSAVDRGWVEQLARRADRLLPVVMASLASARRAGDPLLIRCFDRTVSALHGTVRQLRYHAERWEAESSAGERRRHAQAMRVLSARVDELARMPELCFTDGRRLRSGETYVEVERDQN